MTVFKKGVIPERLPIAIQEYRFLEEAFCIDAKWSGNATLIKGDSRNLG